MCDLYMNILFTRFYPLQILGDFKLNCWVLLKWKWLKEITIHCCVSSIKMQAASSGSSMEQLLGYACNEMLCPKLLKIVSVLNAPEGEMYFSGLHG